VKISIGPKTAALPMPAFLIGSYDVEGKPNVMTAAWGGIASSVPPCLTVGIRRGRWTHAGIMKNEAFTVGIAPTSLAVKVDYVGIVSGDRRDKFEEASLTAVPSETVHAPYVAECPIVLMCRLHSFHDLGTHTLFIGEIMDVLAEESVLQDGDIIPAKVDPLIFCPTSEYYQLGERVAKAFSIGKQLK
jgi:flavin reductase (DIM6/NTAB) family NADH-FMN oxidoreductase RutF